MQCGGTPERDYAKLPEAEAEAEHHDLPSDPGSGLAGQTRSIQISMPLELQNLGIFLLKRGSVKGRPCLAIFQ